MVPSHVISKQIVDPLEIEKMVDKVIADNPKQLEQYRGGKTKLQGYFAGQVCNFASLTSFPNYALKYCLPGYAIETIVH